MLRISSEASEESVLLRIEGRVVGPWVAELRRSCDAVLKTGSLLRLHLAEVEYLDSEAIALLAALRRRGVILIECSPYIAEQMKGR